LWIISLQGGGGSWRAASAFLAQRIRHAQIQHFKRTVNSGFPRYALYLDAHFLAEMCAGILVAVADDDRFEGDLTLDVAAAEAVVTFGGGQLEELKVFPTNPAEKK